MAENVKVAVRVRPFNPRETKRKAQLVIEMRGQTTIIRPPSTGNAAGQEPKSFTFDYSYWSHDGYRDRGDGYLEPADARYADQMKVFNDLGRGVLDNAWKGYNCSLFAYGQTGSGKSYSIVGFGANKGIVPVACEELFKQIDQKKSEGSKIEYQVSFSMLEIYCEKVRDLLDPNPPPKGGLKVREHPKKGFYVEKLSTIPVKDYKTIETKMDQGTRNRTVAATNMNATSSRAHTIVQINFTQKNSSENTTKTSMINLVDLAGSERQSEAGTEGDRLKEGIVINQSLSTLGRCIKALADQQLSKGKSKGPSTQVPFRDSVLTSLLKNALGGNSKTIMIAALSPADINYEETLSTLRFADRAKSIKTQAVVNESATDRMIRELREENQRLMERLKPGTVASTGGAGGDELEQLRAQLDQNRKEMENMEQTWQSRLAEEASRSKGATSEDKARSDAQRKTTPHLWNLNEDPALTDMVVHLLKQGDSTVGRPPSDIQLHGLSILNQHARIRNTNNTQIILQPMQGARVLVNGKDVTGERELLHNDRILFGGNHLYVFAHPINFEQRVKNGENIQPVTYDMAQSEIAESTGLMDLARQGGGVKTKEDMILEEELIRLLPQIYQANAMCDELKKPVKFEIVLVAPQSRGQRTGTTEIFVKMLNQNNDNEFLWDKNKFVNRYYGMQELYQNYLEGYSNWDVTKDRDPFYESPDAEILIGSVHLYLQSLAYMVELDEQLPITDFKGNERGQLKVALVPCSPQGNEITGEFVDSPQDLVGKNLNFKVKINSAMGLPRKFISSRCKYKFYLDESESTTLEVSGSNPPYGHEKTFTFKPVTKQLVDYLKDQALIIEVLGKQSDKATGGAARRLVPGSSGGGGGVNGGFNPSASMNTGGSDAYRTKADQLEQKLNKIQRLLDDALTGEGKGVSLEAVRRALDESSGNGGGGGGPPKNGKLPSSSSKSSKMPMPESSLSSSAEKKVRSGSKTITTKKRSSKSVDPLHHSKSQPALSSMTNHSGGEGSSSGVPSVVSSRPPSKDSANSAEKPALKSPKKKRSQSKKR